ncbi:MAG: MBL fold metallo-hydrolase [Acidobacteriota bacterium]
MATVTFLGACGCVTGSSTLLQWGKTRMLVDCGMYQGDEELEQRNFEPFPYSPPELEAVVLTHAHLDHTGLLPKLVRDGFRGPIYCTQPARGLVSLVLQDAAKIQEEQARWARKKGYSRHRDPQPLYTSKDAKQALKQLRTLSFDKEKEIHPGIHLRYTRAGHLLGAGSVEIRAKGSDGERRTWCFSGDVGRYGVPILKDPEAPHQEPDVLVLESTYGDRVHPDVDPKETLGQIVEEAFGTGGSVIVPAFALGRSQEILYYLAELVEEGRLEGKDVFLDSPMAIKATKIYDNAEGEHDEELEELDDVIDPLAGSPFQHCQTVSQSKALNGRRRPMVIVASSGMATAGRVVHHLLQRLGDPRSSIVFAGYQAHGTRGRDLLNGAETVSIFRNRVRVKARIRSLPGLSAHADCEELVRWTQALPAPPKRIFLNHGEDGPRAALAAILEDEGLVRAELPWTGDQVPW